MVAAVSANLPSGALPLRPAADLGLSLFVEASVAAGQGCTHATHARMVHAFPLRHVLPKCHHPRAMKKTLHIDEYLLRQARSASGARSFTETLRLDLEALVHRSPTTGCGDSGARSGRW